MDGIVHIVFFVIYIICFSFLYVKNTEYLSIAVIFIMTVGFALYSINNAYLFLSSNIVNTNILYCVFSLLVAIFGLVAQMISSFLFAMGMININLKFENNSRTAQHVSPKYVLAINEFKKNTVVITTLCFILLFSILYKPEYIRKTILPTLFSTNILVLISMIMYNSVNQYLNAIEFVKIRHKQSLGLFSRTPEQQPICDSTEYRGTATKMGALVHDSREVNDGTDGDWNIKDITFGTFKLQELQNWNTFIDWKHNDPKIYPPGHEPVSDEEGCEEETDSNWFNQWDWKSNPDRKDKLDNLQKRLLDYKSGFNKDEKEDNILQILATETEHGNPGNRRRFFKFASGEIVYITETGIVKKFPDDDNNNAYKLISLLEVPMQLNTSWNKKYNTAGVNIELVYSDKTTLSQFDKLVTTNSDDWSKLYDEMVKAGNVTKKEAIAELETNSFRKRFVNSFSENNYKIGYITKYNCVKPIDGVHNIAQHADWTVINSIMPVLYGSLGSWNKYQMYSENIRSVSYNNIIYTPTNKYWVYMSMPGAIIRTVNNNNYKVIPQTGWW